MKNIQNEKIYRMKIELSWGTLCPHNIQRKIFSINSIINKTIINKTMIIKIKIYYLIIIKIKLSLK